MTPKEIRIGNLVYLDGEVRNVLELSRSENIALGFNYTLCPFDHVKPIGLTEEWLIKFGFKYDDDECEFMSLELLSGLKIHSDISDKFAICTLVLNRKMTIGIEYVHQLQNLYFTLTGEELTIS